MSLLVRASSAHLLSDVSPFLLHTSKGGCGHTPPSPASQVGLSICQMDGWRLFGRYSGVLKLAPCPRSGKEGFRDKSAGAEA